MDKTNAERQRRFIQRLKARAAASVSNANAPDPAAEKRVAELEKRNAHLEAEIARLRHAAPAAKAPLAKSGAEQPTAEQRKAEFFDRREIEIRKLQGALGAARKEIAALQAKLDTVPLEQRDAELARLKIANQSLRKENKYLSDWAAKKVQAAVIPKAVKSALQKALTAEHSTKDERVEALTRLMDWVNRDAQAARKSPRA